VRESWRDGDGGEAEVVLTTSLVLWQRFFFIAVTQQKQISPSTIQYSFTLPLEVVGPGDSLSTVLYSNTLIMVRLQLESVLAGGNGDGGAYSCNRTKAALVFSWGESGGGMAEWLGLRRRWILNFVIF
jgi:hypothetical protein